VSKPPPVESLVVISDTHIGCKLGLMPKGRVRLDEGGHYSNSPIQRKIRKVWDYFWEEHVPSATGGKPFDLVFNGDIIDGAHHNTSSIWSSNIKDQRKAAVEVMAPVVAKARNYYHIRGTSVHVGEAGSDEEAIAEMLGAIPDQQGNYARNELWYRLGDYLGHILHHVGTTSRVAYESSAVMAELAEAFVHSAQWGERHPDFIVRSHRHRYIEVRIPSDRGYALACTLPSFQGKSSYAWKIAGARQTTPQFGGIVIRVKKDELYTRPCVWSPPRARAVVAS